MQIKKLIPLFIVVILLAACSGSQPADAGAENGVPTSTLEPVATENIQATIDAGVVATVQAEANIQATIDAAVTATVSAAEAMDETYVSEEELEAAIDDAVAEAVAASEEISTATNEMASDGTITQEEYDELEELLIDAAILIDYAEYYIDSYYYYYGDLAEETIALLEDIEDALAYTQEYYDELIALLETTSDIANLTLDTMLELAENAEANAAALNDKADEWQNQAAQMQQDRANAIANIQASFVPADRAAAIQEAFNYLDTMRASLEDRVISTAELQDIAQIGANAIAGLEAHGGAALQGLSGNIGQLTQQAALGQFGQVANGLGSLEASIPNLPGRP